MIKQEVTYTDFMGTKRTEEFYFNISMTETINWQNSEDGGIAEKLRKIINASDVREITAVFEDFLLMSYGEIADDGRTFVKVDPDGHRLADRFKQTAAYQALYANLMFDQKAVENFINGVVDPELAKRIESLEKGNTQNVIPADFANRQK